MSFGESEDYDLDYTVSEDGEEIVMYDLEIGGESWISADSDDCWSIEDII